MRFRHVCCGCGLPTTHARCSLVRLPAARARALATPRWWSPLSSTFQASVSCSTELAPLTALSVLCCDSEVL